MNWNQIPRIPQRDGYGQGLLDLCAARPDVVVLDADVAASTRTNWVRDRFPDHFYNLGISEQDLVGTAAGLALGGQIPYVSTYGVFLSGRAFDQIRTTVCYNNLKVRFGGAHAGISVGPDGATHQALEDLALARVLPHMTVIAPCDSAQTRKAVLAAVDWPGPVYFRFGREAVPVITDETTPFTIGKARLVQRGRDCAVLALVLLTGCEFSLERLAHGGALPPPPEDYTGLQDGFRYTKTTLTGQERYLYDQLLAGLQNQEETIGDLYPDTEMIQTAIDAIDRDYPELFWFSGTGQIETTLLAGKPLEAAYTPVYTMDQAQRQATQAQIDQWAADCFATIPQGASDYDKALGVFTYIIQHADYQVVDNNSIVNIMVGGAGLCGCYAKTTQYLLGLLGVDTAYITGQAQGESHAWNLAWLDGTPCWIDTTWGDPVFTGGDDSQGPAYEYFGLTTDDLLRTHTIDDKVPVPDCTSNSNNYFFRNGLYFSAYDPDALTALFQRALAAGQRQVSVRYADAAYPAACAALFDQGQLNTLLGRAREALDSPVSLAGSLWYTRNETMGTLSFLLPLSSSPGAAPEGSAP